MLYCVIAGGHYLSVLLLFTVVLSQIKLNWSLVLGIADTRRSQQLDEAEGATITHQLTIDTSCHCMSSAGKSLLYHLVMGSPQ